MRIVCIGDSNTKGLDPRSYVYEEYEFPWPRLLARRLNQTVINEGEHGVGIYYTEEQFSYLDSIIKEDDIILLMLGTNDVLREVKEEEIVRRLDLLVNYLNNHSCILISPVDVKGKSILQIYQRISSKYHKPLFDANEWSVEISFDGIHYTQTGHERFARNLEESIKTVMKI